jgi:hypothetical protein
MMSSNPLQKRVNIEVSLARPQSSKQSLPRLVVVGVVPFDAPIISERSPGALIKRSSLNLQAPFVEQVRLTSLAQAGLLPGIDGQYPSRLKDAVTTILELGSDEVDCILVRVPDVKPWELTEQSVVEMLMGFFADIPGAMIVFPDAGGPWPRAWSTDPERRLDDAQPRNLVSCVQTYGPAFSENFQLGFMDMVSEEGRAAQQTLNSVQGYDITLCAWSGTIDGMMAHGWRSSAAFLAGYINKRVDVVTQSLVGHEIPLVGGRKIVANRARLLGGEAAPLSSEDISDSCAILSIDERRGKAQVLSEYTLRRPRYEWSIPVMRTVKAIHQSLRQAADMFVFRPVKKVEAVALEKTVEMVLNPFYERGILVGAEGTGRPTVTGEALPSHDQPMLSVDLSAMVRPWCQNISLKVMVRSGEEPVIENSP